MTNVYKIEVVVVDYDDLGEGGITSLIEGLRTPYTVLSYVTNIQEAWVDDIDSVGRRQLIEQKLPELFNPWQPINTAPKDGTCVLFFYGARNAVFTAWYEKEYWHLVSPTDEDFPAYLEEENPTNCYWQCLPELPV